jgi:hypothetical protein
MPVGSILLADDEETYRESSRQASGFVKLGDMCCTTTIGGMGGRSASNNAASAGGPPVDIPIATHLPANSGVESAGADLPEHPVAGPPPGDTARAAAWSAIH